MRLFFVLLAYTAAVVAAGIRRNYQDTYNAPATVTMFLLQPTTVTQTVTAYIYGYPTDYFQPDKPAPKPTEPDDQDDPKPTKSNNPDKPKPTKSNDSDKPKPTDSNDQDTPTDSNDWKSEMLRQVNAIRAKVNKPPLSLSSKLNTMAQAHSNYQASINKMTHDDSAGTLGQRATKAGVKWSRVAENVAMGYRDVSAAVNGWRNSEGHYMNMIGDYTIIGLGETKNFWTQEFAKPS